MNLELLNPFEQDYPENIEHTTVDLYAQNTNATCISFNRRGTLLAAGCQDGQVFVWDFDTKGVARILKGHVSKVTSVSWSRNGRYLLTSGEDFKCIHWDLISGTIARTIPFDTGVAMAQMHPKKNDVFVAALKVEAPVLVDISGEDAQILELPADSESSGDLYNNGNEKDSKPISTLVCRFDIKGERIFTGSSKGAIHIIDANTRKLLYMERISGSYAIKNLVLSRDGRDFIINASDRSIRVYSLDDEDHVFILRHTFTDVINKVQWNQCCFNRDGEYVIGGSAHKMGHNIYIWDKERGNLVKMLEGPKEQLNDLAWHPVHPIIASAAAYGSIYIWATEHQENWSAFAPHFKELDENVEYEEREDEFDIVESTDSLVREREEEEDEIIDITTIEKPKFLQSDPEEDEEIYYLPTHPDEFCSFDEDESYEPPKRSARSNNTKNKNIVKTTTKKTEKATNTKTVHNRSSSDDYTHKGKKRKLKGSSNVLK
ncbi:999_t:CDS:2 [Ambispora leptoticha]|uniref:999_t:CDS:1 n=1 Tax=Ambispora leptoticha TaxID=144679 RepID=A0A9N9FG17_9GLOM|nr:999_t:CDS:2 [Ambispora leptoticha]